MHPSLGRSGAGPFLQEVAANSLHPNVLLAKETKDPQLATTVVRRLLLGTPVRVDSGEQT